MAPNPDRELGEARASLDRGNSLATLKHLDRARRGYVKQRDPDGLDHVLRMSGLVDATDDRVRIGRENLEYAVKQNLRQESRRQARERDEAWADPYPDLQAPAEHTGIAFTRGVKVSIGAGVGIGTAALAAIFILPWFFDSGTSTVTLRLLNDTPRALSIRGCSDPECDSSWMHKDVEPGLEATADVDPDDLVDLFEVGSSGPERLCLPVRVHDGYLRLAGGRGTLAVRLSAASLCPGTTVLPETGPETGI